MSAQTIDLFADALRDIASGPHGTDFQKLTEGLMRRMAEKGVTLEQLTDRKMLARSRATLERHASTFGIRFPDFTPPNMRVFVQFIPAGDFLELTGEHVEPVAKALDLTVIERNGIPSCGMQLYAFAEAKKALRRAGFEAKKSKPLKKRKAATNG